MWQDNIDATIIINLPERKDRLEQVNFEFQTHNIKNFKVWPAIKNKNGALGLMETMGEIFEMAEREKLNRIAVFEDDVKFVVPNVNEMIERCINQLKIIYFDLFYLGGNLWKRDGDFVSENLLSVTHIYALHGVIYSDSGISKMNRLIQKVKSGEITFQPLDVLVEKHIQSQNNTYAAYPLLATQRSGYSDIEKKTVNYHKFIEQRYEQVKQS